MGEEQDAVLRFLNEGLDSRTEYHFYWDRDVLSIWFYVGADRKRKTTSIARPETVTAKWRSEARQRATEIVLLARSGRVLEASSNDRVQVTSTVEELRDAWVKEQITLYPASWKTRRIHINNIIAVFTEMADALTPLQRMVEDRGPQLFVNVRMRQVAKETVVKEVGTFFHFLTWLHEYKQFITAVPPHPKYRAKDLGTRVGPQRSEPVHLEDHVAIAIINLLPEYASRGGRKGAKLPAKAFPCRDMMRFHFETGLRPSTIHRLAAGTHWVRGWRNLKITPDIDKGRNAAQRGKVRLVPLTDVALDILERHAPDSGLIFGRHNIRVQWKRAAIAVLGPDEGARCAPYDLRHGANYRMRSTVGGSLAGSMHMVGHSRASTNDLYMRGTLTAASEVVERLNERNSKLETVRKVVRNKNEHDESD